MKEKSAFKLKISMSCSSRFTSGEIFHKSESCANRFGQEDRSVYDAGDMIK